ncbi:MAG TPA: class I SAM-dependent methyltransferase, partial [Hyphomonadaceae bacterium]|nr:class I SAM-dependent methyltransferase [Hyphomonadaceae bacterium]
MVSQISVTDTGIAQPEELYQRVLAVYESLGYPPSIVNSWAISAHDVPDLLAAARRAQARKILEVGTYVGVSTMLLALACPDARIVTVDPDLPLEIEMGATGSALGGVDARVTTLAIARTAAEKLGIADRIAFVKGGFAVRETFSSTLTGEGELTELVGPTVCNRDGPFDFVFIDGLHTADAVSADLELAAKHLTPAGFIALHDCVGFWGANVRAGIMNFLARHQKFRFQHPPFADLWRSLGVVAPVGSKALASTGFAQPVVAAEQLPALGETFSAMLSALFGGRDVIEVYVGTPLLPKEGGAWKRVSVRVLSDRSSKNINADLDRILGQVDALKQPVIFSADLLDFAPSALVQNLLAAVAFRGGAALLGVTPPGETGIAGPESKPAAWLVDAAKANNLAAYAPAALDLEPARYALLPELRELGRSSRLASILLIAPAGGFTDARGRQLAELSPVLACEREQAELQRVHLTAGYRR